MTKTLGAPTDSCGERHAAPRGEGRRYIAGNPAYGRPEPVGGGSPYALCMRKLPGPEQRLRCAACGNLTRFDVTRTSRTTEYWHFDLAGGHRVEQTELLAEEVGEIRCRWCGGTDVEIVATVRAGQGHGG